MRIAIVTAIGCLTLATAPAATQSDRAPDRVIDVVAERFSFTPSVITVTQGEIVELRLTSDDTDHGFHLTGPQPMDIEIPKRGRGDIRVRIDATEAGDYVFECSLVCGAGHDFMRGTLRIRPRPDGTATTR